MNPVFKKALTFLDVGRSTEMSQSDLIRMHLNYTFLGGYEGIEFGKHCDASLILSDGFNRRINFVNKVFYGGVSFAVDLPSDGVEVIYCDDITKGTIKLDDGFEIPVTIKDERIWQNEKS